MPIKLEPDIDQTLNGHKAGYCGCGEDGFEWCTELKERLTRASDLLGLAYIFLDRHPSRIQEGLIRDIEEFLKQN